MELRLSLAPNTVLIVAPLVIAGLLMMWRHERSRHYVEADVEWWTLLFFMMLFAVAVTTEETRVTEKISAYFRHVLGDQPSLLIPVIISLWAIGSTFVGNMVLETAFAATGTSISMALVLR